jgi:hypothetical protein
VGNARTKRTDENVEFARVPQIVPVKIIMKYPKIQSAHAISNHVLSVEFNNGEQKRYDILPLLKKEMFLPLQNPEFFKNVQVETGGYAVWTNGE